MTLTSQNINVREAILLIFAFSILLITLHHYFGIAGIMGGLLIGVAGTFSTLLPSIKGSIILLFFIAVIPVLNDPDGIQAVELPFLGIGLLLIGLFAYKFLNGSLVLENSLDYAFLLLHFLLPYGVVLGKINGAATYQALGEVVYYLGVFTYFPLRNYLRDESFKKVLATIVFAILTYVLIRNFIYYRQIIAQALLPWQAESARVAANELIIVIGCSFSLSIAALTNSKYLQLLGSVAFIVFMISLVLTQSRGYWIAGFFSVITIFGVIKRKGKLRILSTAFAILIFGVFAANVFFDDLLSLILNALGERLKSIGTGSTDNSLQDRWLESKTVFFHVIENPIAGYGLGAEFTRKKVFFDYFIRTNFIHNGYLGAIFKFGISGLLAFIFIWFSTIKKSVQLYKRSEKMLPLAISGIIVGMLFVNNTSSQIMIFEGIAFTTLAAAYINTELEKID